MLGATPRRLPVAPVPFADPCWLAVPFCCRCWGWRPGRRACARRRWRRGFLGAESAQTTRQGAAPAPADGAAGEAGGVREPAAEVPAGQAPGAPGCASSAGCAPQCGGNEWPRRSDLAGWRIPAALPCMRCAFLARIAAGGAQAALRGPCAGRSAPSRCGCGPRSCAGPSSSALPAACAAAGPLRALPGRRRAVPRREASRGLGGAPSGVGSGLCALERGSAPAGRAAAPAGGGGWPWPRRAGGVW